MKKILYISFAVFLVACHTTKTAKTTPVTVEVVAEVPNDSLVELNRRKNLYEQHCMSCHELQEPTAYSEEAWRKIVPNMVRMINKKGMVVDTKTEEDILSYLVFMRKESEKK
ncbi:MAG: hypothetical protein V4622_11630 [Bacteroidota bacterium]